MRIVISFLTVLILGSLAHGHDRHSGRGFMCVRNGNYEDLVNVYTRNTIWRFDYSHQCDRAREQARTGFMCVPNKNAASLITEEGEIIQNFTFSIECEKSRREILSHL